MLACNYQITFGSLFSTWLDIGVIYSMAKLVQPPVLTAHIHVAICIDYVEKILYVAISDTEPVLDWGTSYMIYDTFI